MKRKFVNISFSGTPATTVRFHILGSGSFKTFADMSEADDFEKIFHPKI